MSLYQRHRPASFDEVVGNATVVANLRRLVALADPPHAYLFVGPTGCGKTTLGRIVALALGCDARDYTELDSADFRGIETVRNMRHNAYYRALVGHRRVWLVDEAHKLTNEAQNALLKGLEDPPEHCYYILATTDPDKLLSTVRSRCSIHGIRPLTAADMVKLLARICTKEGVALSRKVLQAVAWKASTSFDPEAEDPAAETCYPRQALQILEKVLVAAPEQQLQVIEETADLATTVDSLVKVILKHKGWKQAARTLATIDEDDVERVRRGLLGYCRKVLLGGENETAAELIDKLQTPFYDSGLAGLTMACYVVVTKNSR